MKRAPRPLTSHFAPSALVEAWAELAALKHPGWDWDGSTYSFSNRSNLGDAEGIAKHSPALKQLLLLAPTGFPSHPDLRAAMIQLHNKFDIFKGTCMIFKDAAESADRWRVMCRHLYNRRRDGNCEPSIKGLMDLIELPKASKEDLTTSGMDPGDVQSLFPDFDEALDLPDPTDEDVICVDDDVQIVNVQCHCPACKPKTTGSSSSTTPTSQTFCKGSPSETSALASLATSSSDQGQGPPIPDPGRGQQNNTTLTQKGTKPSKARTTFRKVQKTVEIILPIRLVLRKNPTERLPPELRRGLHCWCFS